MTMRRSIAAVIMVGFALSGAGTPGHAAKSKPVPAVDRLEKIEQQLNRARVRAKSLEQEADALADEAVGLRRKIIAAAARIQASETQITVAETRLRKLTFEHTVIAKELVSRHAVLGELLAGLQKLRRNPPPALVVQPNDALKAVRSAMLLGTVVPEVRAQAEKLGASLNRLQAIRTDIVSERQALKSSVTELSDGRTRMTRLMTAKQAESRLTRDEVTAEKKRMAKLARDARSLQDLISRLGMGVTVSPGKVAVPYQGSRTIGKAALRTGRTLKPAIRFSRAKGRLAPPAQGAVVRRFGSRDNIGGQAKGVSIATRNGAQITAPSDGRVRFAGSFRSYGQLLIIDAGEGYHILLAGMSRISVDVGHFVFAGEPLGIMGQSAAGSTKIGNVAGETRPVLYVEFRNNGRSVNPRTWWAGQDGKVHG